MSAQQIYFWFVILVVPLSSGCNLTTTDVCASGIRCPVGMICTADGAGCRGLACGDGIVQIGELCDDGNVENGDTCSNNCMGAGTFGCRDVPFPEPSAEMVDFSLNVISLVGQTPYEGLTLQACPSLDPDCAMPIDETTTDAAGDFTISLQEGFRGHLSAAPPEADPTLAPLKAHIFPPPSTDPTVAVRGGLVVTTLQVIGGLAAAAQIPLESGSGHIFFTTIDCQGQPLNGVAVSSSVQGTETFVAYLGASGQPDLTLIGTGSSGFGMMINVPTGFVTVRGVHATEGLLFEQSVLVAPDTITSVPIVPSPTQ